MCQNRSLQNWLDLYDRSSRRHGLLPSFRRFNATFMPRIVSAINVCCKAIVASTRSNRGSWSQAVRLVRARQLWFGDQEGLEEGNTTSSNTGDSKCLTCSRSANDHCDDRPDWSRIRERGTFPTPHVTAVEPHASHRFEHVPKFSRNARSSKRNGSSP